MSNQVTQAFVYKWIHKPTGMWYIGSRTARGCHINDGYICSSKIVKPMIESKPEEWERYIIATGLSKEMRSLETKLLIESNAKKNMMSFNRSNNDGKPVGGRKLGTISRKRMIHPDLRRENLIKLTAEELVNLIVNEKNKEREFILLDYVLSFTTKKERTKLCQKI